MWPAMMRPVHHRDTQADRSWSTRGTGFPGAVWHWYSACASTVTASAQGENLPVLFAGAHPVIAGLDQVNLQLPRTLAGSGTTNVVVTAGGQASNAVTIAIQ